MKNTTYCLVLLLTSFTLTNSAIADDIEDIKNATLEHFDAQNRGDALGRIAHHMPYHSQFSDGSLLKESHSIDEQIKATKLLYESGINFNLELSEMNIKVYSDTAVVTGYVLGTISLPDGVVLHAREQRTAVLIKVKNEWKEVHVHISPLK